MKKISIIILLSGFIITGCTNKLEEINVNPNQPDKVSSPGLLLPNVIRSSARSNLTNSYNRFAIAADQLAEDFQSNFSNWVRADAANYSYWNFYDYIRDLNTVIDEVLTSKTPLTDPFCSKGRMIIFFGVILPRPEFILI